jgi:hypothetical protein
MDTKIKLMSLKELFEEYEWQDTTKAYSIGGRKEQLRGLNHE